MVSALQPPVSSLWPERFAFTARRLYHRAPALAPDAQQRDTIRCQVSATGCSAQSSDPRWSLPPTLPHAARRIAGHRRGRCAGCVARHRARSPGATRDAGQAHPALSEVASRRAFAGRAHRRPVRAQVFRAMDKPSSGAATPTYMYAFHLSIPGGTRSLDVLFEVDAVPAPPTITRCAPAPSPCPSFSGINWCCTPAGVQSDDLRYNGAAADSRRLEFCDGAAPGPAPPAMPRSSPRCRSRR